jgi:hypothetical protein
VVVAEAEAIVEEVVVIVAEAVVIVAEAVAIVAEAVVIVAEAVAIVAEAAVDEVIPHQVAGAIIRKALAEDRCPSVGAHRATAVAVAVAVAEVGCREVDLLESRQAYTCKSDPYDSGKASHGDLLTSYTATDRRPTPRTLRSRSSRTTGLQSQRRDFSTAYPDATATATRARKSYFAPTTSRYNLPMMSETRSSTRCFTGTPWPGRMKKCPN